LTIAAFVVSVIALFVGLYAGRITRQVGESGFKAEEQFKADLVILLSSLRSIIVKGALNAASSTPLSIEKEIDTIRTFQASTSGLALATWAAHQGSIGDSKEPTTGRWRTLGLDLGHLSGITGDDVEQGAASNDKIPNWATSVELCLENLTEDSVREISRNIRDLPRAFAALRESREDDVLLKVWFGIYQGKEKSGRPEVRRRRLEHLRESGIDDPDIDAWLALISGNKDDFQAAVARGANTGSDLNDVLARYEGNAHEEERRKPGSSNLTVMVLSPSYSLFSTGDVGL
jgi:hypothetical protein